MIGLKNFFKEDFSEVVGIYFDGAEIFLSRGEERFSAHFEVEEENFAEQLAEKVLTLCNQRGWDSSKVALCLREADSTTIQAEFENIPEDKREGAVQSWATAQVGENALCTFAEVDGEFWAEAMSQVAAEKFISAFAKNSMTLCAMTRLVTQLMKSSYKPIWVAQFAEEENFPNLLKPRVNAWNFPKIFAAAGGAIFIFAAIFFGQMFFRYFEVRGEVESLQKKISLQDSTKVLKENFDANIAESRRLNEFLAAQPDDGKLNILIKLGQIADDKIHLTRINFSSNLAEVEGHAASSTEIKDYLGKLKRSVGRNAKPEKISTDDGKVTFTIRIDFQNSNN